MKRECLDCETTDSATWTRGLCKSCYGRHHHAGTLDKFPVSEKYGKTTTSCTRCGIKTTATKCQDCCDVEADIAPIDSLEGHWVRHNLVMHHQAA